MERSNITEDEKDRLMTEYLLTLSEKEYKAYLIAVSHLGTSFDLVKCNGYLTWLKSRE